MKLRNKLLMSTALFILTVGITTIRAQQKSDTTGHYAGLLVAFKKGRRDTAFLKNLILTAIKKSDQPNATKFGKVYVSGLKDPYAKESLSFIYNTTLTSKDAGFSILFKNRAKVNEVLGKNWAEYRIRIIIANEELKPYMDVFSNVNPDWAKITQMIVNKYGDLGLEKVYGLQMIWYDHKKDWNNFGKYYALYYKTAITRSEYHMNNLSWSIFEHIEDLDVLKVAVATQKYSMENFGMDSPNEIDTYASLLYKVGKKQEAIQWEEKALQIENQKAAKDKRQPELIFAETLERMKAGIKTWTEQGTKQ